MQDEEHGQPRERVLHEWQDSTAVDTAPTASCDNLRLMSSGTWVQRYLLAAALLHPPAAGAQSALATVAVVARTTRRAACDGSIHRARP